MAHAISQDTHVRAPSAGDGFVARIRKALADHRTYRTTLHELAQLSDRDLNDLGISRHAIRAIARESVYGR